MLHQTCIIICKKKTANAIARGEEPPWVVFMLHQQTCVLLIHQLKKLPRKINLHIA
jgi:hypothetical protein